MSDYRPRPIDTEGIELPEELERLTERLAESIHDTWALERMAQGWTHGIARDDLRKEHPCLVPYLELPDHEKIFDRNSAQSVLKAILSLGYRIERRDGE